MTFTDGTADPSADDPSDPNAAAPWTDDETRRRYRRSLRFVRQLDPAVDIVLDASEPDA